MTGLRIQSDELKDLKYIFEELDKDQNGSLSKEELSNGFGHVCMLELLQDHVNDSFEDDFEKIVK